MKLAHSLLLTAAAAAILIPGLALAHHGYAAFDTTKKLTLKATVTDFHFVNPHSVVEFDVKNEKGETEAWEGELTSPLHLKPRGWTANTLEAGDKVTIAGFAAKNGTHSLWITQVILANGKEMSITIRD
jgi:hypothetical protein